ncbi:protein DEHYDRATION-INDUCED 19 homolog 5-like isoform X2 [Hibiscus syriacus]|uniref:protein DEHYDRATION-INDUCED 19 homolog 5-like isoform X2 n=1 Tax=Hibiscus syriacus TaxID=106335 RepID=UPI0019235667|nr:protein DEHYDRATION-INDUCED 19 homolog 5-like isoform X2 [Hibiscus syriacus]
MEDDTWSFSFSAPSRSYQSTLKSHSDLCIDFEEIEEDDELMTEYPCPYCSEDFDLLGLCCHIDEEHHLEAGYRVCPVCAQRVGMNMVDHITTQHGNIFKSNHKLNFHKGPDPLVSFLYSAPPADSSGSVQPASSTEVTLEEKGSDAKMIEKDVHPLPLSDKEHWEKANKCEFVQGLLLSTIFDGGL